MAQRRKDRAIALLVFRLKIFLRARLRKYGHNYKDRQTKNLITHMHLLYDLVGESKRRKATEVVTGFTQKAMTLIITKQRVRKLLENVRILQE